MLSRDYWRANLASLYSPPLPPSPSQPDAVGGVISPAAATPLIPAAALIVGGGSKRGAVLDLGEEQGGDEEQGLGQQQEAEAV